MPPAPPARAALAAVLFFPVCALAAGDPPPPTWTAPSAEVLAERERIRPAVEAIFAELRTPPKSTTDRNRGPRAVRRLVDLGPSVAPFLESEIDLPDFLTFNVAAAALGLLDTPGAADALRRADDRADATPGRFSTELRGAAVLGLGFAGKADAVTRVLSGQNDLSTYELGADIALLDVVSVLSYPASYDVLVAQLTARTPAEAPDRRNLPRVVAALGKLLDPRAVPRLLPLAADADPEVRREVVHALGRIGDPAAAEALVARVQDADWLVARAAAHAVARVRPVDRSGTIVALLDHVQDPEVRAELYGAVQGMLGPKAYDHLIRQAGRPDFVDRSYWIRAVAATKDRRAVATARAALSDPDAEVTYAAMDALASLGGEAALDSLLAVAGTRPWHVAKPAVDLLLERGDTRVASRVAERLSREVLASPLTDARWFTPLQQMLEVLVDCGFTEPAAALRRSAEDQPDGGVVASLRATADDLDRIRELGNDPARWSALLDGDDPRGRKLAVQRLVRIGGPAAVSMLERRFASGGAETREEIVEALAKRPQPEAAGVFERALDDPAFDELDTTSMRAAAAWGARRLGGPRMTEALSRSAARTRGIDLPTLVYWAQLAGPAALPEIEKLRASRLRSFTGHRWEEQTVLDELVTDLRAGRSIAALDVPPEGLHRH